ncbi:MAG: hypothetical protein NT027_08965 [Proteobacteria bacterium]|nr:hypothetical protein [Pseudomonadota bacterium]
MTRILRFSLVAFSLGCTIVFMPTSTLATADGPDFYCVKAVKPADVLNLRSQPTAKSEILFKIPHNACRIKNLGACVGKNGENIPESDAAPKGTPKPFWCHVSFNKISGWVAIQFLKEDIGE